MKMVAPTALIARLCYEFEDMPEAAFQDALIFAAREITRHSLLECTIDLTDRLQCGEDTYEFDDRLPEGTEVSSVRFVKFCGRCIEPIADKCDDCSCGYRILGDSCIRMQPETGKTEHQTLELCVALQPCYGQCNIPDILLRKYREQLMEYARGFLERIPNTKYTNINSSKERRRQAMTDTRKDLGRHQNNMRPGSGAKAGRKWLIR